MIYGVKLRSIHKHLKRNLKPGVFLAILIISFFIPALSAIKAIGSYNNANIADHALTKVGQYQGQCRTFVNNVVFAVSGGTQRTNTSGDYFQSFLNAGGSQITNINSLVKGDIVQVGQYGTSPGLHTFIIVSRDVDGRFWVVDSNSKLDGIVRYYKRVAFALTTTTRAYRMGIITGTNGGRLAFSRADAALFRVNESSSWTQMNGAGTTSVSVDGDAMAMVTPDGVGIFRMNDSSPWTTISPGITSVSISSSGRLAFVREGYAYFRVGNGAPWQLINTGIKSVAVDNNAMAFIYNDGTAQFRVNDSSPWTTISSGVTSVDISDSGRMAFSRNDGAYFRVNGNSPWTLMAGPGAFSVSVDGTAMAMIVPWQGAIYRLSDSSPWVTINTMAAGPTSVSISG